MADMATTKKGPSLSDIAQMTGVSRMTVSRVLNQSGYVSPETREKVIRASAELNYRHVPNAFARIMRGERSGCIATILGSFSKPTVTGGIMRILDDLTFQKKYLNFVLSSAEDAFVTINLLDRLAAYRVEGIIYQSNTDLLFEAPLIERLQQIPHVVAVTDQERELPFSQIVNDWAPGIDAVVGYFAMRGCRKPMLLQDVNQPYVKMAFLRACKCHAMEAQSSVYEYPNTHYDEYLNENFAGEFPADAVFCSSEHFEELTAFLARRGVSIPVVPTLDRERCELLKCDYPILLRNAEVGIGLAFNELTCHLKFGKSAPQVVRIPFEFIREPQLLKLGADKYQQLIRQYAIDIKL